MMARHWRATYDYAAICLVSTESSASMVASAAFHQVLGRPAGGALRPQLLAAVRDMIKEWAAEDRISALLPELRKPTGGRGLRAARSATPERRKLAERAFRALPGASQCLLWHIEVEAEPITVPAGLLGVDTATATAALDQVREQFRQGCVRAHRELAPTRECRYYNRLLDVPIRRGGTLLPDVQEHLTDCRYCRHAAEQLSHFEGGLEVLLAETVLGWGARRYLDSRPGRGGSRPGAAVAGPRGGGRHRPGHVTVPRRRARAVALGIGLTSLALLATVLTAKGWSEETGVADPQATWGAPSGATPRPDGTPGSSDADSPSAASATHPAEIGHGRLRNAGNGLCLNADGRVRAGAAAMLAACSPVASQQWSYRGDGLLRSVADPTLCLDSDADEGTVVVADCLVHDGEVRYDLTVHGELLLRRSDGLVVAPGEGAGVVVTERDGSAQQRWVLDAGAIEEGAPLEEGGAPKGDAPEAPDAGPPSPGAEPTEATPDPAPEERPEGDAEDGEAEDAEEYDSPFAQVDAEPAEPQPPVPPAVTDAVPLPAEVLDTVSSVETTPESVVR
ncbi:hydrolase [Streptomyces dysideae]|uniref:Hydrolase n=1 Tax=Streptomyces dysideae TaxID=909626 RepID=A0A117RZ00_9ACTN|nr:hydrolase [Streptomyces dysideae]